MSQISVLGFTPTSSSSSSYSSSTHWTILISPDTTNSRSGKSRSRRFQSRICLEEPKSDSVLFDMHKHQLRQQSWPIPIKEESESTRQAPSRTNTRLTASQRSSTTTIITTHNQTTDPPSTTSTTGPESSPVPTTTTLNASASHPSRLTLKIATSTLPQPPSKLIPKLTIRLRDTPTYGSEEDWLRSALASMHDCLLEPGFDVENFIDYACEAAKEYSLYEPSLPLPSSVADVTADIHSNPETTSDHTPENEPQVLELDYTGHLRRNAEVKALLSHHHHHHYHHNQTSQASHPPDYTNVHQPRTQNPAHTQHDVAPNQSEPTPASHRQRPRPRSILPKWLSGFHVSPSPTQIRHRDPRDLQPWQRRDDPYAGMM